MKRWLADFKYDWTLIFAILFMMASLAYKLSFWTVLITLLLIGRILCLKNRAMVKLLPLVGVFFVSLSLIHIQSQQMIDLPLAEGQEETYHLHVSAIDLRHDEGNYQGKATLIWQDNTTATHEIPVEFTYWYDGDLNLPNEIYTSNTTWLVEGTVERPSEARNFHVFDYRNYLATQNIYWQVNISQVREISPSMTFKDKVANFRLHLLQPFIKLADLEWVSLHNRLLFNLNSYAYSKYKDAFMEWGIVHFFAISGFHIHFIRKWLRYCLLRCGMTNETTEVFTFIILACYGWIIRWPIGVVRSYFTSLLRLVSHRFNLPLSQLDQMALIGITLLIINPNYVQSLGFTLSFLMTYVIRWYFSQVPSKPKWQQAIEMNFVCLLFSWPLFIQSSFEINLSQIITISLFTGIFNTWLMPLMAITTVLLIINLPINSWLFAHLSVIFEQAFQLVDQLEIGSYLKHVIGYQPDWLVALLLAIGIYYLITIRTAPWRGRLLVSMSYLFVILILPYFNPSTILTVIDVGQGDALLVQPAWKNQHWLIDTGGKIDWSEETVKVDVEYAHNNLIPALKALGVNQLTGVIVTHPDIDHLGNFLALSQTFDIEQLYITDYTFESDLFKQMVPGISHATNIYKLGSNMTVPIPDTGLTLITLDYESFYNDKDFSNNTSIVTWIDYEQGSLLNLGDISVYAEEQLVEKHPHFQPTFIKLAHHGSQTSTSDTLLTHYHPNLALISAGANNRYGHPHEEVLDRLIEHKTPYLSTSERGAIQIKMNPFMKPLITYKIEGQ